MSVDEVLREYALRAIGDTDTAITAALQESSSREIIRSVDRLATAAETLNTLTKVLVGCTIALVGLTIALLWVAWS